MSKREKHPRLSSLLVLVTLSLCLLPSTALAGPWTPAPAEGYAKVWVKWLPGFGYHPGNASVRNQLGNAVDYGAYHEVFLAAYGEVGLADGLALFVHSDLARAFWLEDPRSGEIEQHIAPGDPALGMKLKLFKSGRFIWSLEGSARFPLATSIEVQEVFATDDAHTRIGALRVGSGVFDFAAQTSFGYGWDTVYAAASAGWLARTGGYDHALLFQLEAGMRFSERWQGRGRVTGHYAIRTGNNPRDDSPSGIGNGTSYTGLALEADYEWTKHWYIGTVLEGGLLGVVRQTGGPVISVYVAHKF